MGGAEWIERMLAGWQSQVLDGFLGAEASPRVLLIAGAWFLARGGVTHAGAGRMGFVPRACAPLQAVNSRSVWGAED